MKHQIILWTLLIASCTGSFAQKASQNDESLTEKGLVKVSIMYPFAEDKTFNFEYYQTKHMPMVAGFLGSNLIKYTIEKGISSGIPNQPPAYIAIGTFYVKSLEAYRASIAPNRDAIRADFPNYTNSAPVILISEVVR